MKLILKIAKSLGLFALVALPLALAVKGLPGNITEADLGDSRWTSAGPFELSVERGRFALTFSLAEHRTVFYSLAVARFTVPDLGYIHGQYVSLFAPAVSFLALPGYVVGKYFGASQVGSFATSAVFALLNFYLLRAIARLLGAGSQAAVLGALTFLFATPAFAYSTSLYQHHISTFLILGSLYVLIRFNSLWSQLVVWALCAASIPVDYPNLFLMFPIGLLALGKFISLRLTSLRLQVHTRPIGFITLVSAVLPVIFLLWFNRLSYQNPLQFSGTVATVREINPDGTPATPGQSLAPQTDSDTLSSSLPTQSALGFFNPRNLVNGLYIHLFSPDRGIFVYTPVILLGVLGLFALPAAKKPLAPFLVSIVLITLTLYSLWGDPWGGWAFGSRYLIPAYAIAGVGLSFALNILKKKLLLLTGFFILFAYSIGVNTLGAITSNAVPPRVEVLALEKLSGHRERYSFDRNWEMLLTGGSKSFLYQALAKSYLSAWQYYLLVLSLPVLVAGVLTVSLFTKHDP